MKNQSFQSKWQTQYDQKTQFFGWSREPFYKIAENYLPDSLEIAIDIGAGNKGFAHFLSPKKSKKLHLLDGNPDTIAELSKEFSNAHLYTAPNRLPFEDLSVAFVHCSHLIEHLGWQDLEELLREINRVLKIDGVIVISTPMLCDAFFGEFSHVRPYNPEAIETQMVSGTLNSSIRDFTNRFERLELVYRYAELDPFEGFGSTSLLIDKIIQAGKWILRRFGIKRFTKTGYTLVLAKKNRE